LSRFEGLEALFVRMAAPARKPKPAVAVVDAIGAGEIADETLVRRALEGDRWAEEALFRRHAPRVLGTVTRLLGKRSEAEDIAQDTFVAAFSDLGALREPGAFGGWVLRIAVSKVHRVFRRERILRFLRIGSDDTGIADLAAEGASPDQRAELVLLEASLARVASANRVAWMLRHVEGLALDEVAHACTCSLATAKRRIARADSLIASSVRMEAADV
jgi:RNA polymerase sigma-70 factor (ECF subfamily)